MNLGLLCRINGVWVALNGLSAILMPDMWFSMAGLDASNAAYAAAGGLGVSVIALGLISWRTADIAGDAITQYGKLFGIIHCLFILLTLYQMSIGLFNGAPAYFNIITGIILAGGFFYYSRG